MRTIHPIPLSQEAFAPFGRYYNLRELPLRVGDDFRCALTDDQIIDEPMSFGFTYCLPGSFQSVSMERHFRTEEAQFCGDGPTILTVANTDPEVAPSENDVVAFRMEPGDVVVLHKAIWHDANHAIDKPTLYYFLAKSTDDPREIEFVDIQPQPVFVALEGETERGSEA